MEINKKSRTELKAYFVKNALPTESNFRDLIDAGLNQKDDGLVKAADQPAQIAASTAGDKPAIHLYESFATDTKPAWALSLQAGGKKGFGVGDGDGNNRLFIDATTGGVGIGTADPASNKLRVAGNVLVDGSDGNARLSFGSKNRQMLNLYKEEHGVGVQSSTTYFRSSSNFAFYKGGTHSDGLLEPGTGGAALLVIKDGNVGIGTNNPETKLTVASSRQHVQLRREKTETTVGSQIFLELFQDDNSPPAKSECYPNIRFHHAHYYWVRIEGRSNGFHLKDGDPGSSSYVSIYGSSFQQSSDRRLKRDIAPLGPSLGRVLRLQGAQYRWVDEKMGAGVQIGLIAQDVEAVFPEVVSSTDEGTKGIDYARLVAPLIEAVKELAAEVEALKLARAT
ncbi:tail fiber domain-containing protein [Sorangium sp. So ce341]|uniref:tail fiber domain-containing protein n=1 Tax=Sorangium sp. So ce341 TaxID=3133302 RepID=UPI003F5E98E2